MIILEHHDLCRASKDIPVKTEHISAQMLQFLLFFLLVRPGTRNFKLPSTSLPEVNTEEV